MNFEEILLRQAQGLKAVDRSNQPPKQDPPSSGSSLQDALLRNKRFKERKEASDVGTEQARLEEERLKELEKQEAEQREAEHQRRVQDLSLCITCGEKVDREARDTIGALERFWHEACFRCSACRQPLPFPGEFFHLSNRLLCAKDYKMRFYCAHCELPIVGQSMSLFGQSWHPDCVIKRGCFGCAKPITEEEFLLAAGCVFHKECLRCDKCNVVMSDQYVLVYGRPWCVPCNEKFLKENRGARKDFSERRPCQARTFYTIPQEMICAKCGDEVKAGMDALGKKWHNECFCCFKCGKCVTYEGYLPNEEETEAFCEACYNAEESAVCPTCNQPIVADFLTVMGKEYHPNCVVCAYCSEKLGNEIFDIDEKPACGLCVRRQRLQQGFGQA